MLNIFKNSLSTTPAKRFNVRDPIGSIAHRELNCMDESAGAKLVKCMALEFATTWGWFMTVRKLTAPNL